MKLKTNAIITLINENFFGNKAEFARKIGVDRTYIPKALSMGSAGSKFCSGLTKYCENNKLDKNNYIFFLV